MIDQMQYQSSLLLASSVGGYVSHSQQNIPLQDSAYGGGIGSRLDSNASDSSENSKENGKPPRRRSHRPRGCRGGSNRRRNRALEGMGEPKESDCIGKERLGSKKMIAKHSKHKLPCISLNKGMCEKDYDLIFGNSNRERTSSSSSTSTCPTADSSSSHDVDDLSFLNDVVSTIHPTYSDLSSSEACIELTFQRGTPRQILPPLPSRSDCPPRRESFSDPNPYALQNTGDVQTSNIHQQHYFPQPLARVATRFTNSLKVGKYQTVPNEHHQGLASQHHTTTVTSNVTGSTVTYGIEKSTCPPPTRPVLRMPGFANMTVSTGIGMTSSGTCHYNDPHYSVVGGGGSLFLTSPRSFLMGKRSGTMTSVRSAIP